MSNENCPCRPCVAPKRHPGCHGTCPEYKEWNESHQQDKIKIQDVRHMEYINRPRVWWINKNKRMK